MYPVTLYQDYHEERVRRVEQFARERDLLRSLRPQRRSLAARVRELITVALVQEPRPQEVQRHMPIVSRLA
jgi:hypothetical protein